MSPDLAVLTCVMAAVTVAALGMTFTGRYVRRVSAALRIGLDFPRARLYLEPLHPDHADDVADEDETVGVVLAALAAAGFQDARRYRVGSLPGSRLVAVAHLRLPVLAVVFVHRRLASREPEPPAVELFAKGPGDQLIRATTEPDTSPLPDPPFLTVVRVEGADPDALLEAMQQSWTESEWSSPQPLGDEPARTFEAEWARQVDWLALHGVPSREQLHAFGERVGEPLDEAQLDHAHRQLQRAANAALYTLLDERARQAFPGWPDNPDEEALGIVHDRLTQDEVMDIVVDWLKPLPEQIARFPSAEGRSPREVFAGIVEAMGPEGCTRKVGTLQEPVVADVYSWDPTVGRS